MVPFVSIAFLVNVFDGGILHGVLRVCPVGLFSIVV